VAILPSGAFCYLRRACLESGKVGKDFWETVEDFQKLKYFSAKKIKFWEKCFRFGENRFVFSKTKIFLVKTSEVFSFFVLVFQIL
jgi:hypothetical protein